MKPAPNAYPSETTLVHDVIKYLRALGHVAWRNNTGAVKRGERWIRFGVPGLPDVLGVRRPDGRLLGIECKVGRNTLDAKQAAMLETLRQAGAIVGCARSIEAVGRILRGEAGDE